MQTKSPEDDFDLGFRGAPDEIEARAMSYVRLCTEIEDAKPGTTKFMLLETEKRRRDSVQLPEPANSKPDHAGSESTGPHDKPIPNEPHWWKRPLGMIFIGVSTPTLAAIVLYLLAVHFGVSK